MREDLFHLGTIEKIGQRSEQSIKVRAEHPLLDEHFPGFPVVPGSVTVSMVLAHARAVLGTAATLGSAAFLRPIRPAECLTLSTSVVEGGLRFILRQGSQPVCRGVVLTEHGLGGRKHS